MNVSVIVPVRDEEESIRELLDGLHGWDPTAATPDLPTTIHRLVVNRNEPSRSLVPVDISDFVGFPGL